MESFGISDIGNVRKNNEDAWGSVEDKQFYVLADGIGGHNAGEVASHATVRELCKMVQPLSPSKEDLRTMILACNRKVHELSLVRSDLYGMGTTLCCFWVSGNELVYAHVGDSRVYRYRKRLKKLTRDHSLKEELLIKGEKERAQASKKNVITKAIGTLPYVEPDVALIPIEKGDIYFLCSDGLTDMVEEKEIEKTVASHKGSIKKLCETLVYLAKSHGGSDNITIVMIQI